MNRRGVGGRASVAGAFIALASLAVAGEATNAVEPAKPPDPGAKLVQTLTLEECLAAAMEGSHRRPASRFAVLMAEAQHRQALSGYWPQLSLKGAHVRMDEAPNFIFPATTMGVPAQSISIPGGTAAVTIPANAFGPGFPPSNVQLPVSYPGQTVNTPPGQLPVEKQDIKLADRDSCVASLNATWLLYDGGMRRGLSDQAKNWVEIAKQEARRTDLEIADSIRRLFHGAVLARQVHKVGSDTLARMETTLEMTESLYKDGAGKVKKTDYLSNKVMVETLRAAVALLEKNQEMAQAALANTMGLPWNASVVPSAQEIPFEPLTADLGQLVGTAYQFSPDWAKLEAGTRAVEGAVKTAWSGHLPKVALTGELHRWENDYNAGMATNRNKEGWSVGIGFELPLFDGFLTRNRVREAKARRDKLQEEKFLLREGIGLQVRDIFLGLNATQKSHQATLDAMKAATENRDLNTRAYQNGLVETEDVIRAQLVEALMSAQHYKVRFDHVALRSQLNLVVGTEVLQQLRTPK